MDSKSSLTKPAEGMSIMLLAGFLPMTGEYSTFLRLYPGNNAHAPWGTHGTFYFSVKVYEDGKQISSGESTTCDEKGWLHMDLSEVAEKSGHPVRGMFIMDFHHAKDIPVEVYAFHVHKLTGTYIACNVTPFIGDELYPAVHSNQMENTLFWPGMIAGTDNEVHIVVLNPFDLKMGFQIHLIEEGGVRMRTGMMHLKPKQVGEFPLFSLFNNREDEIMALNGRLSICVSSQYKLVAYIMFKSRGQKVMSMVDHLHTFCLV
jgi:hypothetical protein